jgi:hypothetical protein
LKPSRIPVVGKPPDGVRDGVDVGGRVGVDDDVEVGVRVGVDDVEVGVRVGVDDDVEVGGRVALGPAGDAVTVAVAVGGSAVAVGESVDVIVGGTTVAVGVAVGPTVPKASETTHPGGLPFGGTNPPPSMSVPLQEAGPSSVRVVPVPSDIA